MVTTKLSLPLLFLLFSLTARGQIAGPASSSPDSSRCEQLAHLSLPNTKIASSPVAAGSFVGPPAVFTGADLSGFYKSLPAFCRVEATAQPTSDSNIKIEVWLPAAGWNGKLQGIGNGGFAGLIDHFHLGAGVMRGYVTAATDTGHAGSPVDATWALGHPEKLIDFGHRGIHEMTRVAKSVIQSYYATGVKHSYFLGCSDGGREALMEAQRYPEDYDGIMAGAPANYWTALLATAMWNTQALTLDAASYISASKVPAIDAAVAAACDDKDGVRDGILTDPRECKFDPAVMLCKNGEESDKCLTAPQAAALKKLYAGPRDSHQHQVFPGYLPGAEAGPGGWGTWITGPAPLKSLMAFFGVGYFSYMVDEKPDWDYKTFAIEKDLPAAEQKTAAALNAIDPNLAPFQKRGGKLILYHGWNDPAIPSINTINYYESVVSKMGKRNADAFTRLYMVPGMQHCAGGPGADSFGQDGFVIQNNDVSHNLGLALERWAEKGEPPSGSIATHYEGAEASRRATMTRPLCAYPQKAVYKGAGDTSDAASFECK